MSIAVEHLEKRFGTRTVLREFYPAHLRPAGADGAFRLRKNHPAADSYGPGNA